MRVTSLENHQSIVSARQPITVRCDYVPLSHLANYLRTSAKNTLAIISFNKDIRDVVASPCLINKINTPQLGDKSVVEVWTSSTPVNYGEQYCVQYSASDEVLFGSIRIAETDQSSLDVIARKTYESIFALLQVKSYPHLIRAWNYLPNINQITNGLERYRLFCLGRHQAFSEHNSFFERDFPAASAIGTRNGDLQIYFLAARHAAKQIENPRQISAFHYPLCYGPRSPSFSRAMLKKWERSHHLYISGTASIVGHTSCHVGDLDRQLQETLLNIESILTHANHISGARINFSNNLASLKIYIRHPEHLAQIQSTLERHFTNKIPALYLQGDICRNELLLEIEAICHVQDN